MAESHEIVYVLCNKPIGLCPHVRTPISSPLGTDISRSCFQRCLLRLWVSNLREREREMCQRTVNQEYDVGVVPLGTDDM